jgi:hypothetical protein
VPKTNTFRIQSWGHDFQQSKDAEMNTYTCLGTRGRGGKLPHILKPTQNVEMSCCHQIKPQISFRSEDYIVFEVAQFESRSVALMVSLSAPTSINEIFLKTDTIIPTSPDAM